MATISLGSHTVFHYYRYKPESDEDSEGVEPTATEEGRSNTGSRKIDMSRPVLSLLLEPRSLVITKNELYTNHLHGIGDLTEDVLLPTHLAGGEGISLQSFNEASGVRIANNDKLSDERIRELAEKGGRLQRGTRISLTCRDVEQVVSMKSLP